MDENLEDNKIFNNNILFKSKYITENSKMKGSSNNNDEYKYNNKYLTSREKNEVQKINDNLYYNNTKKLNFNDRHVENKKFIRLQKGLHLRIKPKSIRNNKNNEKINKIFFQDKNKIMKSSNGRKKQNISKNNEYEDNEKKFSKLIHSYSVDNYLNFNSNNSFKSKSDLENSQLFNTNFVKKIKNEKRKNDLFNAIERYKRFTTLIHNNNENLLNRTKISNNEIEIESVSKRLEQINRIKIQNIINFKKLYETFQNRKSLDRYKKNEERKEAENNGEKKHKIIFSRQLLREEKFTISDDGKEKVLEINHTVLPERVNIKQNNDIKQFKDTKDKKYTNNERKIIIYDKNNKKSNNEGNNILCQKKRSVQNLNNNFIHIINENKNKIFIKKRPNNENRKILIKLNNKNLNIKKFFKRNPSPEYNIFDNIKNHSFHEIKNIKAENNQKNQNDFISNKKSLIRNFGQGLHKKPNYLNNNNFQIIYDKDNNNYFSDYNKTNIAKKNVFRFNTSYDSKNKPALQIQKSNNIVII